MNNDTRVTPALTGDRQVPGSSYRGRLHETTGSFGPQSGKQQRTIHLTKGRYHMKKALLILICLSFTLCAVPAFAFETYRCGDQEVTIWGFVRNNLGMFERTQEFTNSGNQLATARTWLRGYMDWKMSDQFKFYTSVQFVWEPWYKVEQGSTQSENGGSQQHRKSGWKTYSEFDDVNDVIREVYIEWKPNKKNTIKFGRQIAIWGEALTDRVGDVIHPNDNRFAFAFANLEDTRIPQYMIRGIHDISSINSSFEWIINPLLLQSDYSVNRNAEYYNQEGDGGAEQRFAIHPEDRSGNFFGFLDSFDPTNPYLRYDYSLPVNMSSGVNPLFPSYVPAFAFGVGPLMKHHYPDNFEDTRFGFRTSTLLGGYQFGVSYFHTQNYDPMPSWGAIRVSPNPFLPFYLRDLDLVHPTYDILGFYMNKQLPWPGVIRGEMVYSPNKPFTTFDISPTETGIVRRDWVKYLVAYDLNSYFYFDWHKTAAFDITLEHIGEWVPNSSELQYGMWSTRQPSYHAAFNLRISTNWYYNRLSTDIVLGYDTFGNSGLFMPTIKWMPGWMNQKFSAELKYIGLYGDDDYSGIGIFRKKDMFILTTQFNF